MAQNTAAQFQVSFPFVDKNGKLTQPAMQMLLRLWNQSFSAADTNLTPKQLLEQAALNGALLVPPSIP